MWDVGEIGDTSQKTVQDTLATATTAEDILRAAEETIERLQM